MKKYLVVYVKKDAEDCSKILDIFNVEVEANSKQEVLNNSPYWHYDNFIIINIIEIGE